jgi:hypothetical protein
METVEVEAGSRRLAALLGAVAVAVLALLFTGGAASAITTTTTTVTSSLNPAAAGQVVQFSATVTPGAPGTPTGTVTFTADGFTNLGSATLSGGVASVTTSFLSIGSHSIVATYSGDVNFSASSGSMIQSIVGSACTPGFNCGFGNCIPGINCGFGNCVPGVNCGSICVPGIACGFGCTPGFTFNCNATCVSGSTGFVFIPGVGVVPVGSVGAPTGTCTTANQTCTDSGPPGVIVCTPTTPTSSSTGTSSVPAGVTVEVLTGSGGSQPLNAGCNQVTVLTAPGTPTSTIAFRVSGSAVDAIWRFNNATKMYDAAYFGTTGAPVEITVTAGGSESYYVCVPVPATIISG